MIRQDFKGGDVLQMGDCDAVVGDEVETVNVCGYLLGCGEYPGGLLYLDA